MSTSTTKIQVLHEASRLLLARGLHGFGLQELAAVLKIKKASLFYHYPSKTALAVELYRFYQTAFVAWTERHAHLAPERQVLRYAETLTSWICEKQRVCPVGALSLEWHLVGPELQTEIKKLHELQRRWLAVCYRNLDLAIPRAEAVTTTMALIQGSIQLARVNDDPKLVLRNLKTYLKSIKR
jgi:TetR/AcrR family transcriptional repressor of nem operon